MHNGIALNQAIAACQVHAVSFRDLAYRAIHLRWFDQFASANPLFAAAGGTTGSRYVPPHGPAAALYTAPGMETAYREMNQDFYAALAGPGSAVAAAGGLRPDPAVLIGVHLDVSRLLDLRVPAVLQLLNTNNAQLLAPWKNVPNPTATQQLGAAVFQGNWFEGIFYPSAQHANHHCIVIFRQRLLATPAVHFQGFQFQPPPRLVTLADTHLP
jgi:RES domain-containing protein